MRSTAPIIERMSIATFLDFVETRPDTERWALDQGVPVKMMGSVSEWHARIAETIGLAFGLHMRRRGCNAYRSDIYVRHPADDEITYAPDIVGRCGPVGGGREIADALVIVEVLSPSTMETDRGRKLAFYKTIPSLQHIALVYQDEMRIETWDRAEQEWQSDVRAVPTDLLEFAAVEFEMTLAEAYDGVVFPERRRRRPAARP